MKRADIIKDVIAKVILYSAMFFGLITLAVVTILRVAVAFTIFVTVVFSIGWAYCRLYVK